jgi:hypothetical protein
MFRASAYVISAAALIATVSCNDKDGVGAAIGGSAGTGAADFGMAGDSAGGRGGAAAGAANPTEAGAPGQAGAAGEAVGGPIGSAGAVEVGSLMPSRPGGDELGGLSNGAVQTLCAELNAYYIGSGLDVETLHFSCLGSAFLVAESISPTTDVAAQGACKESYDACLMNNSPGKVQCSDKPSPACKVTVEEYTKCLNDSTLATHQAILAAPSCEELTKDNVAPAFEALSGAPPPTSCQLVATLCPELWGSFDPVTN